LQGADGDIEVPQTCLQLVGNLLPDGRSAHPVELRRDARVVPQPIVELDELGRPRD
jgi:hypothetical protein